MRSVHLLTRDLILTVSLRLQRLDVDALVPDESGAGDPSVRLTETFSTRSKKHITVHRLEDTVRARPL